MSERVKGNKTGVSEKAAKFYRDFNILGAAALFGIGLLAPPVAPAMNILAGIDVLQAGGGEIARRAAKKSRQKRKK